MSGKVSHAEQPASIEERQLLDVAVIVCSIGRPAFLLGAVQSILEGDALPGEIVIVDQSDGTSREIAALARSSPVPVKYIQPELVGVSRARNLGVAATRCPIVAFIDDDVIVCRNWLRLLVEALRTVGPKAAVTGMVRAGPAVNGGFFAPSLSSKTVSQTYEGLTDADVLSTGNMAIYQAAFDRVGYFDVRLGPGTAFPAAEDNDFGLRLLRAGYKIHYETNAVVEHVRWRRGARILSLYWGYGHGQGAFYAKHMRKHGRAMWRRLGRDLFRSISGRLWRGRDLMRLVFAAGMLTGCARWLGAQMLARGKRLVR